jgi:hypothetical protein
MCTISDFLDPRTVAICVAFQLPFAAMAQITSDNVANRIQAAVNSSRPIAISTLTNLAKVLTPSSSRFLGLSIEQLAAAELGDPIVVFPVRLALLKGLPRVSDPYALMGNTAKVLYPVLIQQNVRSCVVVLRYDEGWKLGAIGGTELIQRLTKAKGTLRSVNRVTFAVQLAPIDLYFLASKVSNSYDLIAIDENSRLHLKTGDVRPSLPVLQDILPAFGID